MFAEGDQLWTKRRLSLQRDQSISVTIDTQEIHYNHEGQRTVYNFQGGQRVTSPTLSPKTTFRDIENPALHIDSAQITDIGPART
ncbi:hypothetical protein CY34DRAFT_805481 [Suillus luteus UH-Slu-Lm8-n1]|uniref:Uncharacterized protein n=1 Tax=Suillus luteus UH-Slu-Lm8-n1 TaxID=930992 RepID=A0A0D0AJ96_9AGAM|nr:hypothetical protein CY34DRAFT_805481 [Suillus luteus UH-Slu-Lm8-n1]